MERCVIYSRVSSDQQEFKSQISDLIKYATGKYEVAEIFSEKVSVYKKAGKELKTRPAFDAMKSYIRENGIKRILMWEISRLARNSLNALTEFQNFGADGIGIYFYKEGLDSLNPEHNLTIYILCGIAEKERNDIMSRVTRGSRESAKDGKRTGFFGGSIPYGYKVDENSFIVIDEEEAEVIRDIFELADRETSQRSIADTLNKRRIPTRWTKLGRVNKNRFDEVIPIKWKPNAIGIILRNTIYKGERKYKSEVFKSPVIIEPELWDRVQGKTIKKIGYFQKKSKYQYLLKGKIQCGKCGRLYGVRTELRYGKEDSFYTCNGRKDLHLRCKNGQFSAGVLDNGVFDLTLSHKDFWIKMKEDILNKFNIDEKMAQIGYCSEQIAILNKKHKRIIDLFKNGHISMKEMNTDLNSIKNQKEELTRNINTINTEIEDYNRIKGSTDTEEVIGDWLRGDTFEQRQEFINKFLDKIIIHQVNRSELDLTKLKFSNIYTGEYIKNNPLSGRDKLVYLEIFAYGSTEPLRCYLSNHTKLSAILKTV